MKTYSCNINDISEAEFRNYFDAMSSERKESTLRLQNAKKQKSRIAADYLCRTALSDFCGIEKEKIEFALSASGKPFAVNCRACFNISHSGDHVICAVSDKEIGIDIEKIRPINPKIAEKFACDDELDYIHSNETGFFEIWTLKEAYFKCIGTGLGANIKSVSFKISENGVVCSENGFECSFISIADGYVCSVCEQITDNI